MSNPSRWPVRAEGRRGLGDTARLIAEHGWMVFPCRERDSTQVKAKAPYTRRGFKDASRDPAIIARWWREHPEALIGAPVPDGCLVLDIDPRHGGSREALEDELGPLPVTLSVWSGRNDGGCHLFYRHPNGTVTGRYLPLGVDLKLPGKGYTILPPSPHPATGAPYSWEIHPLAGLPLDAVAALRERSTSVARQHPRPGTSARALDGLIRTVETAPDGRRNVLLNWATWTAAGRGAPDSTFESLVEAGIQAGLSPREAQSVVEHARRDRQRGGR